MFTLLVCVLLLSFVSANWFSDLFKPRVTGKAIDDGSLVAYYNFNNDAAGNVYDDSGKGNTGQLKGNAQIVDGELLLDGNGDYVDVPNSNSINIEGSELTISVWINPNQLKESIKGIIVAKDTGSGSARDGQYSLGTRSNKAAGYVWPALNPDGSSEFCTWWAGRTGNELNIGEWQHVVMTYDSSDAKIYINGDLDSSQATNGCSISKKDTTNLAIGGYSNGRFSRLGFDGMIDNVRIYNRALSEAEIQELYNLENKGDYADYLIESDLTEGNQKLKYIQSSSQNKQGLMGSCTEYKAEYDYYEDDQKSSGVDGVDAMVEVYSSNVNNLDFIQAAISKYSDADEYDCGGREHFCLFAYLESPGTSGLDADSQFNVMTEEEFRIISYRLLWYDDNKVIDIHIDNWNVREVDDDIMEKFVYEYEQKHEVDITPTCEDTDWGKRIYDYGEVYDAVIGDTKEDSCTGNELTEYYCDYVDSLYRRKSMEVICGGADEICLNGVCIQIPSNYCDYLSASVKEDVQDLINAGEKVTLIEDEPTNRGNFVVVPNNLLGDAGRILQVTQIYNSTSGYVNDRVQLMDFNSGDSFLVNIYAEGKGTLNLDGLAFTLIYSGPSTVAEEERVVYVNFPQSDYPDYIDFTDCFDQPTDCDYLSASVKNDVQTLIDYGEKVTLIEDIMTYKGDFIVVPTDFGGDAGRILEVTQIKNQTTGWSNDEVKFRDFNSGQIIEASITEEGRGTFNLDGLAFTLIYSGPSTVAEEERVVYVNFPQSDYPDYIDFTDCFEQPELSILGISPSGTIEAVREPVEIQLSLDTNLDARCRYCISKYEMVNGNRECIDRCGCVNYWPSDFSVFLNTDSTQHWQDITFNFGDYSAFVLCEPVSGGIIDTGKTDFEIIKQEGECTSGCDFNDVCVPIGTRMITDVPSYCDIDKDLKDQKLVDENCMNNYECKSNQCSDGLCVGLVEEIREQTSLIRKILCYLFYPINKENRCECLTDVEDCSVSSECQECLNE